MYVSRAPYNSNTISIKAWNYKSTNCRVDTESETRPKDSCHKNSRRETILHLQSTFRLSFAPSQSQPFETYDLLFSLLFRKQVFPLYLTNQKLFLPTLSSTIWYRDELQGFRRASANIVEKINFESIIIIIEQVFQSFQYCSQSFHSLSKIVE